MKARPHRSWSGGFALIVSLWLASVVSTPKAFAWGEVGHETVAAIAWKHLTPDVKAKVQNLLGSDDFVTSALWADKIKYVSAWCHTAPYHFADIADQMDYFDTLKNDRGVCNGKPDVLQALLKAESQLANSRNSVGDRRAALKFMIHFIGDIHQPLHVGRPEDLGGNKISITWFDKATNLHSVWDTYMIRSAHGDDFGSMTVPESADWYAGFLDDGRVGQNGQSQDGQAGQGDEANAIDPMAWLQESLDYRTSSYSGYADQSRYQTASMKIVDRQIKLAGYRLASWLNAILANGGDYQPSAMEQRLRSGIQAICPDFESAIELTQYSVFDQIKIKISQVIPFSRKKACSQDFQDLD